MIVKIHGLITEVTSLLDRLESIRPFTEREAWGLFRLAALSEAFGWTILIAGILINRYRWPGADMAIPIAGQVHGTFFLIYFGVLIATYTSLRWSRQKFLVAVLVGIPPYGTLLFEQWAARARSQRLRRIYFRSVLLFAVTAEV